MRGTGRRTDPLNVALQDDLARHVTMQRDPTRSRTDRHGPVCRWIKLQLKENKNTKKKYYPEELYIYR